MERPKVLLVGGPDVNSRIELMQALNEHFFLSAAGTVSHLHAAFQQAGFTYDTYPLAREVNPIADMRALAALVCLFRRRRPDLVHAFDTKPCVFARLAARLAGVPVVVGTLPGLGSLYVDDGIITRTIRTVYEKLQWLACNLSDITIFQNHEDAQQFVARGLVPASRITVILGSGVRTDLFDPEKVSLSEREGARGELDIPSEALLVTMVSRLIRSKGILEFVEAARMVKQHHDNVHFLLVGPDDRDSVDRLGPDELEGLSQSVTWLGERRDVPVILALTDIFVLPSFYREGIPRVLLEAASMGLPIVTTDSPGCSEVVEHEVNGFLVPPRDAAALAQAILRLVEEPEMRQRFGQESRQRAVARFDLLRIAGQFRSIYQELLSQKELLPAAEA
jgi:glycosyltransferase involved in cell wall biosynthesis